MLERESFTKKEHRTCNTPAALHLQGILDSHWLVKPAGSDFNGHFGDLAITRAFNRLSP